MGATIAAKQSTSTKVEVNQQSGVVKRAAAAAAAEQAGGGSSARSTLAELRTLHHVNHQASFSDRLKAVILDVKVDLKEIFQQSPPTSTPSNIAGADPTLAAKKELSINDFEFH